MKTRYLKIFDNKYFRSNKKKGVTLAFEPLLENDQSEVVYHRIKEIILLALLFLTIFTGALLVVYFIDVGSKPSIMTPEIIAWAIALFRIHRLYLKNAGDYRFHKAAQRQRENQFLKSAILLNTGNVGLLVKLIQDSGLNGEISSPELLDNKGDQSDKAEVAFLGILKWLFNK